MHPLSRHDSYDSPGRRPIHELLFVALSITGIWLAFAFFNASEFYRRSLAVGGESNWNEIILFQLTSSLVWAVATPFLVALAERLPLQGPKWPRNALILAGLLPPLSVLRAVVGGALLQLGEGHTPTKFFAGLSISVRFHRNIFLMLVIIGITNILLAYRGAMMRERDALALQTAANNAALAQLRARVLPRVMFSTLRTIADRVDRDPMSADEMIVGLSDVLRATLALDRRGEITLAEELEQLDRYLDLEKARAEGRLTTHIDVEEPLLAARVPPLVLQTLVEHALAGMRDQTGRSLHIRGREIDGRLHVEIHQNGEAHPANPAGNRLEQLLAEHFSLDRRSDGATGIVAIELPLRFSEGTP